MIIGLILENYSNIIELNNYISNKIYNQYINFELLYQKGILIFSIRRDEYTLRKDIMKINTIVLFIR